MLGYIIGIIIGLYFKFSIALLYIPIIVLYILLKLKIKNNRYFRYVKLILNSKVISLFIIISIISNGIVLFQNHQYNTLYKNMDKLTGSGIIVSNKIQKEYKDQYKIKILSTKENAKIKNTYLLINVNKNEKLEYGDKIIFSGEFIEPSTRTNYGGFDYKEYLKTIKVYGSINSDNIKIIEKNKANYLLTLANKCLLKFKEIIDSNFNNENAELLKGILLGDISNLEDEIKDNFRASNISHILAVSGMHITYLVTGINMFLKLKVGKNKTKITIIIVLISYIFITGLSPSVVRACIMEVLIISASLIHRESDTITSLSFSLLVLLIYNPFLINNIALQFSYLGTVGILYFYKDILDIFNEIKNKKMKYKITEETGKKTIKVKEILAVTISAQLAILPISIYHFNIFGTYFFITNILISLIIGPIIILGFITIILNIICHWFAVISSTPLVLLIQILILISKVGEFPYAKIYIKTPKIYEIIIYYLIVISLSVYYKIYYSKEINVTKKRVRNLIALAKYRMKPQKKKYLIIIFITIITVAILSNIPKDVEIHFIDVGQGDGTFITTPNKKSILIDGGANEILPYILDRGYTKIDYIFISHFDDDHVLAVLNILQEIKVKNVIIGTQFEDSENYQQFLKIVKAKKIKVIKIEEETRINIEKNLYFDVIWPNKKIKIPENPINNNALVFKLNYKGFSMLFTGDIEKEAERKLILRYKNLLNSTALKVAHHGSNSSSTQEFLELVQPQIALIGVGKNNIYGHPNEEVIKRLENLHCKIYRTDKDGEINIKINRNKKVMIQN